MSNCLFCERNPHESCACLDEPESESIEDILNIIKCIAKDMKAHSTNSILLLEATNLRNEVDSLIERLKNE